MRFRSQVAWTLVIQGIGAAAMLLATLLLGFALGPVAQGTFSHIKAELEFVSATVMLGLPQSLFFYVHASRLSIGRAESLAGWLALLGGAVGFAFGVLSQWAAPTAAIFGLAVGAAAWQGSLRAVVLSAVSTRAFNFVTALPQALLLCYAVWASIAQQVAAADISAAFLLAYCAAACVGMIGLRRVPGSVADAQVTEARLFQILTYGATLGVAAISATLCTLLSLRIVLSRSGAVNLGVYSLGMTLAQGTLVPINYVVPLLFKRWSGRQNRGVTLLCGWIACAVLFAAAGAVFLLGQVVNASRLGGYGPIVPVLWILLLGAGADACHKIVAVGANAAGRPWIPAVSETARLSVFAIATGALSLRALEAVAGATTCAAAVAASLACVLYASTSRRAESRALT